MELSPSPRARIERLTSFESSCIEPGVIVAERFCVIGRVEQVAGHTRVPVTDLKRSLGAAPHHRLTLSIFEVDPPRREQLLRAFEVSGTAQPTALSLLEGDSVLAVVTTPLSTLVGTMPAPRHVALALANLLAELHAGGVTGVRFHSTSIAVEHGAVRLTDFGHLVQEPSDSAADLAHLVGLLRHVEDDALREVLDAEPSSAARLRELLDHAIGGENLPWSAVLPAEAPFVGRAEILDAALEALKGARVAQPSLITLVGPAGAGKSRVLRQIASELSRGNAALALYAEFDASAPEGRRALFAAVDELAETRPGFDERDREALLERLRRATDPLTGLLRRVAPRLSELLGDAPEPPEVALGEDFTRQVAVLRDALASIGTPRRPVVLLVDNVDQADRGSMAVLRKLLAGGQAHHTAVVASMRALPPTELGRSTHQYPVARLGHAELLSMIDAALPGEIADAGDIAQQLLDATDGLPLAVWPTLQHWIDERRLGRDGDLRWRLLQGAPSARGSVVQLYDQRIAGVSSDEGWLLVLAAVFGAPLSELQLEQLAGWNADRVRLTLHGLLRRGLLVAEGTRTRFCHGTVQRLVLQTFADLARRAHARKLDYLDGQSGAIGAAHRAFHAERSRVDTQKDPVLAALHLEAGTEMLRVYDLDRARWHFDRVPLRSDDHVEVACALEGAASTALLQGRIADASLGYALALDEHGDLEQGVLLVARAAFALTWRQGLACARRLIEEALRRAGTPVPSSRLGLLAGIVAGAVKLIAPVPKALVPVREALCRLYPELIASTLVTEPQLGLLSALRAARLSRGMQSAAAALSISFWAAAFGCLGRYGIARRLFDRAENAARASSDPWAIGVVLHMKAHTLELPSGAYESGMRLLDESVAFHRRTGDLSVASISLLFKVAHGLYGEPCSRLEQWLDAAQEAAERQEQLQPVPAITALRLLVAHRRGEIDRAAAERLYREVLVIENPSPDVALTYAYLIETLVEYGDWERAMALGEHALARTRGGVMPAVLVELYVALALAFQGADASRAKRRIGKRALRTVKRHARRVPALRVMYTYVQARRASRQGRTRAAERLYVKLLEQATALDMWFLVHQAHRALAELRAAGRILESAEHVRRSVALAEQLEMSPVVRREPSGATEPLPQRALEPDGFDDSATDLAELGLELEGLLPSVAGTDVRLAGDLAGRARGSRHRLKLLLANLLMTGRDAGALVDKPEIVAARCELDGCEARPSPGLAGRFIRFELSGDFTHTRHESLPGMRGCRRAAEALGGFIHLDPSSLCAYVPEAVDESEQVEQRGRDDQRIVAVVVSANDRVAQTVVAAAEKLGVDCQRSAAYNVERLVSADVAFVDADLASEVSSRSDAVIVALRRRGKGRIGPLELGIPFTFDELESLLGSITIGRAAQPE